MEEAVLLHVAMCILHACVVYIVHACVAYIVLGHIVSHTTRYYRSRLILHQAVKSHQSHTSAAFVDKHLFENVAFWALKM